MSKDFEHWSDPRDCLIFHADKRDQEIGAQRVERHLKSPDLMKPVINRPEEYRTDIYNLPVFRYEDIYVGLPTLFNQSGPGRIENQDGFLAVELAISRDLIHWERVGDREMFIPPSPIGRGIYDTGELLAANGAIRKGDELWFYYSGLKARSGVGGAICLAKLRVDGFVSLDAGDQPGVLLTKPIRLEGKTLHVNAEVSSGAVTAEILSADGKEVLAGFSRTECLPVQGNHLDAELKWKRANLSSLAGKSVRLRLILRNASLYAIWATL